MQNEPQLSAEEVIKDVLTGIKALVQKEMEADQIYQTMLKTESVGDAIDLAEHLMMSLALNLTDILKSKGVKMDNERFRYLLALPYHMSMLEKHIEKTEGMTCCVDKAYSRVVQYINGGKRPMDGSELATALEEQKRKSHELGRMEAIEFYEIKLREQTAEYVRRVEEYFGHIENDGVTGKPLVVTREDIIKDILAILNGKAQ